MRRQAEVERKFEASPGKDTPDLPPGLTLGERVRFDLDAVYFDTPDLLLARNRRTLRRRTGGDDAGWHLKLPGEQARTELHLPLQASPSPVLVPAALRAEVADVVGTRVLVPVARLTTVRHQSELRSATDRVALLADDTVTARRLPHGQATTWRELEVELAGGDPRILDDVTAHWAGLGVRPARSVSKLAQALGDDVADAARRASAPRPPADRVLHELAERVGPLTVPDRDGPPGGTDHGTPEAAAAQHRETIDRLRRTLTGSSPLLRPDARLAGLDDELAWFARAPRSSDTAVRRLALQERLVALMADPPRPAEPEPPDAAALAERAITQDRHCH